MPDTVPPPPPAADAQDPVVEAVTPAPEVLEEPASQVPDLATRLADAVDEATKERARADALEAKVDDLESRLEEARQTNELLAQELAEANKTKGEVLQANAHLDEELSNLTERFHKAGQPGFRLDVEVPPAEFDRQVERAREAHAAAQR